MRSASAGVVAVLVAACAIASAEPRPDPPDVTDGRRCVDVAAAVGLAFEGSYGEVFEGDAIEVAMQRNLGNGAAVGDYDADGDLDVYLLGQAGHPSRLFRNELNGGPPAAARFTDQTAAAALDANRGMSRAALFADLDGDGRLDLVVANDVDPQSGSGQPSFVWQNQGDGTFRDVTAGSGFETRGYIVGGLAVVDEAGTGLPSIYVSYWTADSGGDPSNPSREASRFPGRNQFFRNLGAFQFADVAEDVGLDLRNDSFQAIFSDLDGDRAPDLYLAIDHRPDRAFRNVGGRFVDDSEAMGVGNAGNDMGIAAGDIDADGRLDLYVTNIFDRDQNYGNKPRGNTLLMGDGAPDAPHFTNRAWEQRVHDGGWGWGAAFVDMDLDGWPDIYTVQGYDEFVGRLSPSLLDGTARLYRADGASGFVPDPASGCDVPGDQRALIPFDFDRDGDPDQLITQVGLPTLLLENRTTSRHWLTVALEPTAARATGAWVTVRAGGHTQRHLVLASSSYMSGTPLEAYIGLGDAALADEVTVEWPDGRAATLRDVPADQLLTIAPPT